MKISELPELLAITGDEYLPIVFQGTTYKIKAALLGSTAEAPITSLPGTPTAAYGPTQLLAVYQGQTHSVANSLITWHDQSGNAHDVIANSNGLIWSDGIVFDGASNLTCPIFSTKLDSFSVYVAASPAAPTEGQLVVNGSGTASPNNGWALGFGGSTHDSAGNNLITLIQSKAWSSRLPYAASSKVFSNVCNSAKTFLAAVDSEPLTNVTSTSIEPI